MIRLIFVANSIIEVNDELFGVIRTCLIPFWDNWAENHNGTEWKYVISKHYYSKSSDEARRTYVKRKLALIWWTSKMGARQIVRTSGLGARRKGVIGVQSTVLRFVLSAWQRTWLNFNSWQNQIWWTSMWKPGTPPHPPKLFKAAHY